MNKLAAMQAFRLTSKHLNFSSAAKEMQVSATMISRYIKQLEQNLGCLLLKRNTRKVFLTDAGEQYLAYVVPILDDLKLAEQKMSRIVDEPSGTLTISASIEFGGQYLAPLIQQYRDLYPQVSLDVVLNNAPVDLFDNKIDLAFRAAPVLADASYIAQTICNSSLALWASPNYLATHDKINSVDDLHQHQLLFFSHSLRTEQWLFSCKNENKLIKLPWAWRSNNGRLLNEAAADGQGIIQAPRYSVYDFVEKGELVEVLPEYTLKKLNISAVYPHRYQLSNRVSTFVELAKKYFQLHPIP